MSFKRELLVFDNLSVIHTFSDDSLLTTSIVEIWEMQTRARTVLIGLGTVSLLQFSTKCHQKSTTQTLQVQLRVNTEICTLEFPVTVERNWMVL